MEKKKGKVQVKNKEDTMNIKIKFLYIRYSLTTICHQLLSTCRGPYL